MIRTKKHMNESKKTVMNIITAILVAVIISVSAHADGNEAIQRSLDGIRTESAEEFLAENDVDIRNPESVKNISAGSLLNHFWNTFRLSLKGPAKIFLTVLILSLICEAALFASLSPDAVETVFTLITFIAVAPSVISSFSDMNSAVKSQGIFIASYLPAFAAVTAASGNIAGATAYNALVLYCAEGVTAITGKLLLPMLGCMLVLSCTQAINKELPDLTGTLKRLLTSIIGVIMTVFVGVIGLKTAVGRTGGEIALKAGKFLVSSFVPVIGMSLSESYKTVRTSLSVMRSALGSVGIVVLILILSVPVISMTAYKIIFTLLEWTASLTGSKNISVLMKGLSDVYSLCVTLLLIYALMFLVSTGIIILIGSEAYL